MGHYRSAGKPGARSFELNQPVEALVNFNFDEFLEILKLYKRACDRIAKEIK